MNRYFIKVFIISILVRPALGDVINIPADQPTIQAGINSAANGDTVLVDNGTYYENINFKGKAITVASHYLVDSDTNHISNTIIDGSQPTNPDSGSGVYFVSGEDTSSVLFGFTISGGTGTVYNEVLRAGGGIFGYHSGCRISHNHIEFNNVSNIKDGKTYGGGVFIGPIGSTYFAIIENNIIRYNKATGTHHYVYGGGLCFSVRGQILRNEISNNEASYNGASDGICMGGGISCYNGTTYKFVTIRDNLITYNRAISSYYALSGGVDLILTNTDFSNNMISNNTVKGGSWGHGGAGMRFLYSKPISIVRGNVFSFNHFEGTRRCNGGGLIVVRTDGLTVHGNRFEENQATEGCALYTFETTNTIIAENDFIENSGEAGGGIAEVSSVGTQIVRNKFVHNVVTDAGGGIAIANSNPSIENNLIFENTAVNGGGVGIYQQSTPALINNTITRNTALFGGGIYNELSDAIVINTILWGDSAVIGQEIRVESGAVTVAFSDIENGWSGEGNIDADPMFADTLFHLLETSPCIGKAILAHEIDGTHYNCPNTDIEGSPRPNPSDSNPDIGAYESEFPTTGVTELEQFPQEFILYQNYPNPFNPITTIKFSIPQPGKVTLKVYNIKGQEVATLLAENLSAGNHQCTWDAGRLASGVYVYRLATDKYSEEKKLIFLK